MFELDEKQSMSVIFYSYIKVEVLDINNKTIQLRMKIPSKILSFREDEGNELIHSIGAYSESFDEEYVSEIIYKFGQSANDEFIPDTNIV